MALTSEERLSLTNLHGFPGKTSYPSYMITQRLLKQLPKARTQLLTWRVGTAQVLKSVIKTRLAELPGDPGFWSVLLLYKASLPRRPGVPLELVMGP